MLPRLGLVMATAGGLTAGHLKSVQAAASESGEASKKKIRPCELPIYGEPVPPELELIPEKETSFHRQVSAARQWTWNYLDSIQGTTDMVIDKYEIAKAHTVDALKYLQEDSSALPRFAVITVAGLGGIVAGYKGGKIKKTFLATVGMTAAASVCYPREAVIIGGVGWRSVRDFVKTTYKDNFSTSTGKPNRIVEPEESSASVTDVASPSPIAGDHGMSNPEDKDMYSTRGS